MNYVAILHDGSQKRFPQESLHIVNRAMREKLTVEIEGLPVSGAAIARVDRGRHGEYGPHMSFDQVEQEFSELPEGEHTAGFWEQVFSLNGKRKEAGKRWFFQGTIEWVRSHTALSNPKDIFDFLEAEWNPELEALNVPNLENPQYLRETWAMTARALELGKVTRQDIMMAR